MDVFDRREAEKKRNKKIAGIAAATTIPVLVAAALLYAPHHNNPTVGTVDTGVDSAVNNHSNGAGDGGNNNGGAAQDAVVDTPVDPPVKLEPWEQDLHSTQNQGELRLKLNQKYYNTDLASVAEIAFPNELNGWHSNPPFDGKWTPVTTQDFVATVGEYIERLINPMFGEWFTLQTSDATKNFNPAVFQDMFTQHFWEEHKGQNPAEYMPILADWEGNNFGVSNKNPTSLWYGKVSSMSIDENPDVSSYTVTCKVVFKTYNKQGKTIKKAGKLELTVIATGKQGKQNLQIKQAHLDMS